MSDSESRRREVKATVRLIDAIHGQRWRDARDWAEAVWGFSLVAAHGAVAAYALWLLYDGLARGGFDGGRAATLAVLALALVWIHLGHRVLRVWRTRQVIARKAVELEGRLEALPTGDRSSGENNPRAERS
jgi:hypothetical protein